MYNERQGIVNQAVKCIKMKIKSQPYDSIQIKYKEAIDWLSMLGVKVHKGRLIEYKKQLDYIANNYKNIRPSDSARLFPITVNVMYEVDAIVTIHEALKFIPYNELSYIKSKLQNAVNGPLHVLDEHNNGNKARNYLFEILVSARLHVPKNGLSVDLQNISDSAVKFNDKRLLIECKRIKSDKKIEANVRDAANQLSKGFNKLSGTNIRGLVALDLSVVVNPNADLLVKNNDAELRAGSIKLMDDLISHYNHIWQAVLSKKSKKILGVLLRISLMGVSEARNLMVNCNEWVVIPKNDITAKESQYLEAMALALDYK